MTAHGERKVSGLVVRAKNEVRRRVNKQIGRIYYLGSDPAVGGLHLHGDSFAAHWGGHIW